MNLNEVGCCGIREAAGLSYHSSPEEAMKSIAEQGRGYRYLIFSQAGLRVKYGEKFAAFITENKLGEVSLHPGKHKNPNTNRVLKVWTWAVDHRALDKWYSKQGGRSGQISF